MRDELKEMTGTILKVLHVNSGINPRRTAPAPRSEASAGTRRPSFATTRRQSDRGHTTQPDGSLWVKRMGQGFSRIGEMPAAQAASALGTIAAWRGTVLNHEHPILETELPIDGSRFEGIVSPVVRRPVFAIRLRPRKIFSLDDYEADGILTDSNDPLNRLRRRDDFSRWGARFEPCGCDPRRRAREKEHPRCRLDRERQDDPGQRDSRFAWHASPRTIG